MKILVTGASGFIGGAIVEMLAQEQNYEITATGRSATNRFTAYANVIYLQYDLSIDTPKWTCDICIHCAGLADDRSINEQLFTNNVIATENLLRSLKDCKVFIYLSSASVYDFSNCQVKMEEDAIYSKALSSYGKCKLEAEQRVKTSGISSIYILRPRAVYGNGDRVLLPRILHLIKWSRMIIPGKLSTRSSLTHIDNLCEAITKAFTQAKTGIHIYNITDKTVYDLNAVFASILLKETGQQHFIHLPSMLIKFAIGLNKALGIRGRLNTQSYNYLSQQSELCLSKAEAELGYQGRKDINHWIASHTAVK